MVKAVTKQEFILLRNYIECEWGILLGDDKTYLIENRLFSLMKQYNFETYTQFYQHLNVRDKNGPLLKKLLIEAVTTNETLWFRDQYPFTNLSQVILPELHKQICRGKRKRIQIWSAACSTGQEPYSIAMTILNFYKQINHPAGSGIVNILATDVCDSNIEQAKTGCYDTISVGRGLENDFRKLFLEKKERVWKMKKQVKQLITFQNFNLKHPFEGIFGPFDIVFLRNVLIYFSDQLKKTLFERIARRLNPGGYLFLGSGETVSGYTHAFKTIENKNGIFYQRV